MLYLRMFIMTAISLYTSRVILQALGVIDFGLYNVVGGLVVSFTFITSSLSGASSRYITFGLGEGHFEKMKMIFGNILLMHILLASFVVIVCETVGLWLVYNKLQIPPGRMYAALWTFHLSVVSLFINVLYAPYNATIIAHEKMSAFAYISILDAVLKLVIVYALWVSPYDKLIIYSILLFCIHLLDMLIYYLYCRKLFLEVHTSLRFDKIFFKEIFIFAGWTFNGSLAFVGFTQGLNVLLNIFFGPAVNAARGIAVQVQSIVMQFCTNFQMAINPQITKSYARKDYGYMHQLLIVNSKYSFFLLLLVTLPLILEAPIVLKWWLSEVPDYTVVFLQLVICSSMLRTLANPLLVAVHATGDIKKFQLVEASLLLLIVPFAYMLLEFFHLGPACVFVVHIVMELIAQYARIVIVLPMIGMSKQYYFHRVALPILKVAVISPIVPLSIKLYVGNTFLTFLLVCSVSVFSWAIICFFLGCTQKEQLFVKEKVQIVYSKIRARL